MYIYAMASTGDHSMIHTHVCVDVCIIGERRGRGGNDSQFGEVNKYEKKEKERKRKRLKGGRRRWVEEKTMNKTDVIRTSTSGKENN